MKQVLVIMLATISIPALADSRATRAAKSFGIGLESGVGIAPMSMNGLEAFYNLSAEFQLTLVHSVATTYDFKTDLSSVESSDRSTVVDKADLKGSMDTLSLRWYPGNSFYVGLGLGRRLLDVDLVVSDQITSDSIEEELSIASQVFKVSVGNIWCFDFGLYLGAEWIGYAKPLAYSAKTRVEARGDVSAAMDDLVKIGEDAGESIGKRATFSLLMAKIGLQF